MTADVLAIVSMELLSMVFFMIEHIEDGLTWFELLGACRLHSTNQVPAGGGYCRLKSARIQVGT